jgi:hypothetical protein
MPRLKKVSQILILYRKNVNNVLIEDKVGIFHNKNQDEK